MEATGLTLGGVSLLAPAVQACWAAYGIYTNSQNYGREYQIAARKLMGQRQILESLMLLQLEDLDLEDPKDGQPTMETILAELAAMRTNFEIYQKLINKLAINSGTGKVRDDTLANPLTNPPTTAHEHRTLKELILSKTRRLSTRSATRVSQPTAPSSNTPHYPTTENHLGVKDALILQALSQPPVLVAQESEEQKGYTRQISASLSQKLKWNFLHKKVFHDAIEELNASNDIIWRLVQIRSLADPGIFLRLNSQKQGDSTLKSTQAFIQRFHKATLSVNQGQVGDNLELNVRLVEKHESTRELWSGQEIDFRPGAAVVQVQARRHAEGMRSSLLLVDSFLNERPKNPELINEGAVIVSLKDVISNEPDGGSLDTFKLIGHIAPQTDTAASHVIYQDISTSWLLRSSLATELRNVYLRDHKFALQHIALAVLAALPYTQCVKEQLTTPYPRPQNYQFYDCADEPDLSNDQPIPYVSIGLGSRTPRPLTRSAGRFIPKTKISMLPASSSAFCCIK
ncbi:hypothetical protein MMC17_007190 [Xylographa soralifera]|nr:hypothetical protein [Xylographa soralifera]